MGLNVTSEELNPTNVERNNCKSSGAMGDSGLTIGVIVELEATDGCEERQEVAAENELSNDQLSDSVGVAWEGGGVSLDSANNALPNEARQTESADHRHQATEASHKFPESRRQDTSTSSLLQHTDDLIGSTTHNLRGQDSAIEGQWLEHDFEYEGNHSHETSAEVVEQIDAPGELIYESQYENEWLQDQYDNEDIEGSYLSEFQEEENQDDFQGAVQSWLERPSSQEIVSSGRVGTFYPLDDDNVHSTEIQELLSR